VGAGTVEFLVSDLDRSFYFLEMNTRLQVEHPVTELVTGIDLVREQIRIASGEKLSFTQDDVRIIGHAIECRVYAEDPENNFFPSPGRITFLRVPAGPGIRDDGGVSEGADVSIHYDPMISKLAAWGRTREEAIDRLRRALDEYAVGGIKTTLPFFRQLVRDQDFIAGKLDTGFISRFMERSASAAGDTADLRAAETKQDLAIIVAGLDFISRQSSPSASPVTQEASAWRMAGRAALLQTRQRKTGRRLKRG
jgi:acetyl-CoA carboxylase biotin carboxylase subunit